MLHSQILCFHIRLAFVYHMKIRGFKPILCKHVYTIISNPERPLLVQCLVWFWFNPLKCFFGSEGHVALDRNPGTGYDTLLLRMIPGDLLSAFPHRQFETLPGLLDSWAALSKSNPTDACLCREAVCIIFMMVFGMTRPRGKLTTYCARGGHATD